MSRIKGVNTLEKKAVRLQKYLSACGVASRRKAEEMIAGGKVKVNGAPAAVGQSVIPGHDRVSVGGRLVLPPREHLYIALNKPRGYVTTLSDEMGRKDVISLLSGIGGRVYPVGRLDRDSEGLLLLTDDGEFANALMHPSHHVPKTYHVSLRPGITDEQLHTISTGIELDGKMTAPAKAMLISREPGRAVAEITLYEGRNREVRRMCEHFGLEIARLSRVAVGNLRLSGLRPGEWRELTPHEVGALLRAAGVRRGPGREDAEDDENGPSAQKARRHD